MSNSLRNLGSLTHSKLVRLSILVLFLIFGLAHCADSDTPYRDSTFGQNGIVITDLGGAAEINALALQPDGQLVAVGATRHDLFYSDWTLVRYNSNGTRDPSFGHDGIVMNKSAFTSSGYVVAIQPDGKIVTVGTTRSEAGDYSLAFARYDSDGTFDLGFGDHGLVTIPLDGVVSPQVLVIQADGKILAAGDGEGKPYYEQIVAARLSPEGTPDTGFGQDGKLILDIRIFGGGFGQVAVQPDGKFLVSGTTGSLDYPSNIMLLRYNADGTLDSTFGVQGTVLTPLHGEGQFARMVIQPNRQIVIAGGFRDSNGPLGDALARYNPDGALDSTFGNGGMALLNRDGESRVSALALEADGKIVGTGPDGLSDQMVTSRYNTNGSLDTGFGNRGMVITRRQTDGHVAITIQADGKIVIAGIVQGNSEHIFDLMLVRYRRSSDP